MHLLWTPHIGVPYDVQAYAKEGDKKNKSYFIVVVNAANEAIICYMTTRPKYRKKGYATGIIKDMMQHPFKKIITGRSTSTATAQKLLKGLGFKEEGDLLVWTNPNAPKSLPSLDSQTLSETNANTESDSQTN